MGSLLGSKLKIKNVFFFVIFAILKKTFRSNNKIKSNHIIRNKTKSREKSLFQNKIGTRTDLIEYFHLLWFPLKLSARPGKVFFAWLAWMGQLQADRIYGSSLFKVELNDFTWIKCKKMLIYFCPRKTFQNLFSWLYLELEFLFTQCRDFCVSSVTLKMTFLNVKILKLQNTAL